MHLCILVVSVGASTSNLASARPLSWPSGKNWLLSKRNMLYNYTNLYRTQDVQCVSIHRWFWWGNLIMLLDLTTSMTLTVLKKIVGATCFGKTGMKEAMLICFWMTLQIWSVLLVWFSKECNSCINLLPHWTCKSAIKHVPLGTAYCCRCLPRCCRKAAFTGILRWYVVVDDPAAWAYSRLASVCRLHSCSPSCCEKSEQRSSGSRNLFLWSKWIIEYHISGKLIIIPKVVS